MTARREHLTAMHAQLSAAGITTRPAKLAKFKAILGRDITTSRDLTTSEVNRVVRELAADTTAVAT